MTRFIPTTAIQDIFIHEAFKGFEVRFYLSIVVQGEEDVVVVFPVCIFGSVEQLDLNLRKPFADPLSISYLADIFSKKYGVVQKSVCTSP